VSVQRFGSAPSTHAEVAAALKDSRRAFWSVAVFSGAVNLLMLAGPLYMLQIYDRVLASRSVPTLVALSVLLVGAYMFQGVLDIVRGRIVVRAAALLDTRLAIIVHAAVVRLGVTSRRPGEASQPVRDLDQIRTFLTSAGPLAIVDLPWMPVFLVICFLIHPLIGFVSLAGGIVLLAITIVTERASRAPAQALAREAGVREAILESTRRNAESVVAMGMGDAMAGRWGMANARYLAAGGRSSDVVTSYGSVSKIVRLLLQSMILGLGAYLVIRMEMTAGAMIAASIMMGRALAPIETAIANWRSFVAARQSIHRLSAVLTQEPRPTHAPTELPAPARSFDVEQITVAAPGMDTPIVRDVRFQLTAGEALGIVGPNGAGKTSLVRTLAGIWPAVRGTIRLDGAAFDQWDANALGQHIGFVAQSVDLFDGTVAENISRMAEAPNSEAVLRAAQVAAAHEMILRLPQGYDTPIGEAGAALSAGQRQRIGLARALYGDPFLVVLDEPHANLDNEGEATLMKTILDLKARRAIVIIVANRPSALTACDKVLFLANGVQQAFGSRDEILVKLVRPTMPAPAATGGLKIVSDSAGGGGA
jgi:ATP-binding cassette subfamily C protein